MKYVIIYNVDGVVNLVTPISTKELTRDETILVGLRDVPAGVSFGVIDKSELPSREYRAGWKVDDSELIDGVGK